MTLFLLGIDALDRRHIDEFGCTTFELGNTKNIETFAYMRETPYTLEVWPTIATGLHPREHGITSSGTSDWKNPLFNIGSRITGKMSEGTRGTLGNFVRGNVGATYTINETDSDTIFDGKGRVVHNWPGVCNGDELIDVWDTAKYGGSGSEKFERDVLGIGAQQVGWMKEMAHHNVTLSGSHIHTLDITGHVYRSNYDSYRKMYKRMEKWVVEILEGINEEKDDLLILSDHGMQTEWIEEDKNPGGHSWRAVASTTIDDELPDSVFGFYDWVNEHTNEYVSSGSDLDIPTDQLRDLGYI